MARQRAAGAQVVAIHVTPDAEGPMKSVEAVRAVPGKGLEGDRYFLKTGTYSKKDGPDRQVTLIETEAVGAAAHDYELPLESRLTRRNLVTSGVALNHLVGREFMVGEVRLRGVRLCEPCGHMEKLSVPGAREALVHRGGLRAEILTAGVVRVGDPIEAA
jgi:MOSC domain-containing protein YiiM